MSNKIKLAILVSALGYFVDVYDLVLFNVVRVRSLEALGLSPVEITSVGLRLLNIQLMGMLIGGFLWGIFGDKRGRVSVLFGSIFLYSTANIANAFVTDTSMYAVCRLLAGIGLAGEFGVGITLVNELMSKERRGLGTMIVAVSGVLGAIAGGWVGDRLSWQNTYIVGGSLGYLLLALRISLNESQTFAKIKQVPIPRGSMKMLFSSPSLLMKFLKCVSVGAPIWIIIGLFMTLAPEIGREMRIQSPISAGRAILFFNIGFGSGEIVSSLLTYASASRRRTTFLFLFLTLGFSIGFLSLNGVDASWFYSLCGLLGFGAGYWAVFMLMVTEQFGTNLRATVTTSAPNLVRGLVVPSTFVLGFLREHLSLIQSLALIQGTFLILAFLAQLNLRETFGTDLDFVEN